MPASLLIVLRMRLAGIVLGALFLKTGGIEEVRRSGYFRRMVLVGFVVALELIFYFASIRLANVTVGVSLEYMSPVLVACSRRGCCTPGARRIDVVAVAVAVGGMALLVVPGLTLAEGSTQRPGRDLRPPRRAHVRHGDDAHQEHGYGQSAAPPSRSSSAWAA